MRKKKIVLLSIVIILVFSAIYISKEYVHFKSFKNIEYHEFRNQLGTALLIMYQDRSTRPSTIDDLIDDGEHQINGNQNEYLTTLIKKLTLDKGVYRVKYISDSSTLIVYHIGFDGIDSGLSSVILEFEEMSFRQYLVKPKGDIIIAWARFFDCCEVPYLTYRFFYNGIPVSSQEIESIMFDHINHSMHQFISSALFDQEYIFLLYTFYSENECSLWKGSLLCNWSEADNTVVELIEEEFCKRLNDSDLQLYADSLIYSVIYKRQK